MNNQHLPSLEKKLQFLEDYLVNKDDYSEEQKRKIKHDFSRLKSEYQQRWHKANKNKHLFLGKNATWLQGTFQLPQVTVRPGRPQKSFDECSERSKRRKTEEVRSEVDLKILSHATHSQLYAAGHRNASRVVKEITRAPHLATKYKQLLSDDHGKTYTKLSTVQALAMFVEANLSRRQYEIIRHSHKKMYPSYTLLQQEKNNCYPNKDSYRVTDTNAEVQLQHLMDHTVTRLLQYLEEVRETLSDVERCTLLLICKWGCDGSQQREYKRKFKNDADSDANIFQSSFVPLQLVVRSNKKIVWQNPTPSSPRFCRPIRIRFVKESADITNEEISYIEHASNTLAATNVTLNGNFYSVKHTMLLTMVDGKVCNAATETKSTLRCFICGDTSKDFNNLGLTKEVREETLKFGLSILHARIRVFESILHLAYKLPLKKWRVQSQEEKDLVKAEKKRIQEDFRLKMGLIVDVPKEGFGNTNDGNTSRRFFADPNLAAEITGINANLIFRFKVILEAISSGHRIDIDKFSEYAMDTAKLYVELYSWHPMTPTVHKILKHGAAIIQNALLPIGQLSEEAAEARNKHFRLYRTNFARKFSRESCNLDILNRLLLSSDPLLSCMRPIQKKRTKPFLKETLALLLPAEPFTDTSRQRQLDSDSDESYSIEDFVSSDE